ALHIEKCDPPSVDCWGVDHAGSSEVVRDRERVFGGPSTVVSAFLKETLTSHEPAVSDFRSPAGLCAMPAGTGSYGVGGDIIIIGKGLVTLAVQPVHR